MRISLSTYPLLHGTPGCYRSAVAKDTSSTGRALDRLPEDDRNPVVLSEAFSEQLDGESRAKIARILAERQAVRGNSRSTISRIISKITGGRAVPWGQAKRLAQALGRHPAEVVVDRPIKRPTHEWGFHVIYTPRFRQVVSGMLRSFAPFLDENIHFGFPADNERQFRQYIRPASDKCEYQYMALIPPNARGNGIDLIVSALHLLRPQLFIDFGRIEIAESEIRVYEFWMRRMHVHRVSAPARIWIKIWHNGGELGYLLRSREQFAVASPDTNQGIARLYAKAEVQRDPSSLLVRFPAGGVQVNAPYTEIQVTPDGEEP